MFERRREVPALIGQNCPPCAGAAAVSAYISGLRALPVILQLVLNKVGLPALPNVEVPTISQHFQPVHNIAV